MSEDVSDYLMPVQDKMKLAAYSQYLSRKGLDSTKYHGDAVKYLEGENCVPPLAWEEAMSVLKDSLEGEE